MISMIQTIYTLSQLVESKIRKSLSQQSLTNNIRDHRINFSIWPTQCCLKHPTLSRCQVRQRRTLILRELICLTKHTWTKISSYSLPSPPTATQKPLLRNSYPTLPTTYTMQILTNSRKTHSKSRNLIVPLPSTFTIFTQSTKTHQTSLPRIQI